MKRVVALLLLSLTAFAQPSSGIGLKPESARRATQGAVAKVLDALAQKDFRKLSSFVGSDGLALSPYVTLDDSDVRLSRAEVARCAADQQVRLWGERDGSGDSIEATCAGYFDEFVWSADYREATEVLYNEPRQRGNEINNNHEFAPDGIVVELHVRGTEAMGGMDWKSLRLIFREGEQGLSLIAITRDVWTI